MLEDFNVISLDILYLLQPIKFIQYVYIVFFNSSIKDFLTILTDLDFINGYFSENKHILEIIDD